MSDLTNIFPGEVIRAERSNPNQHIEAGDPMIYLDGISETNLIHARNLRTGLIVHTPAYDVARYDSRVDAARAVIRAAGGQFVGIRFRKRSTGVDRVLNAKRPPSEDIDHEREEKYNLALMKSVNDGMGFRSVPLDALMEIRVKGVRFGPRGGRFVALDVRHDVQNTEA